MSASVSNGLRPKRPPCGSPSSGISMLEKRDKRIPGPWAYPQFEGTTSALMERSIRPRMPGGARVLGESWFHNRLGTALSKRDRDLSS
jgi:hypothetical protein